MSSQMGASSSVRGNNFDCIYPGTTQKLAMTNAHAESSAVGANTSVVQLCSDADCWIAIGPTPAATTSSTYLPAKTPRLFACNGGDKISGITSSTGNLYITEGA